MFENFGSIPENINFGVKASVIENMLAGNAVPNPPPNQREIPRSELGAIITDGTYYVSCLMSLAKIQEIKEERVIFDKFQ
jgi:hypothetical protein